MTGPLHALLAKRSPLLLDGAIGTLLEERGVDTGLPLWSAGALVTAPAALRRIHVEYLLAGADILTTDTFRTTGRTFAAAGLPDTSAELTAEAVALAREARAQTGRMDTLIAGSMGPLGDCYRPDLVPRQEEIRREQKEHADRLAAAGADFLFLETMGTIGESRIAAECVRATGKELAVSFLVTGSGSLYGGETLADAVRAIAPLEPAFLSINCISPRRAENAITQLLDALRALPVPIPAGIYANVGRPGGENDPVFVCDVTPEEYARFARDWARRGFRVIGGCCGTGPAHIAALRREFFPRPTRLTFSMRHKYAKELFTHKQGGELPGIVVTENENLQSRFVVQKVLELREQGVPLDTIAVLFRSGYLSFDLEIELNKANIPFVKFGGFKFMETAHIKDLVAYLRVLENPRDAVAWNRILLLVDGVGPRTAEKVIDDIQARRVVTGAEGTSTTLPSFWAGFSGYPDRVRLLFDALKQVSPSHISPADKIQSLLSYYEPIFKRRYDDYNKRRKDLEMFQQITERYRTVGTLLTDLALEPAAESVTDIAAPGTDDEKLVLSTIHSAKGLEWHSVFVIYALDGRFPATRAALSDDDMEEERRLMYVACTRAQENLFITYPINIYDRESGLVLSKPSRFIAGMPDNLLDTWVVDEE